MTREETIKAMIRKAIAISGKNSDNWSRDAENEIWSMSSDWNSDHDDEIFMCEHSDDDNVVDGFYIEDDYFIVEC